MASNRLIQLLKQRALLEEHLAWLESEINALQSESIETPESPPTPTAIPPNRLKGHEAFEPLDFPEAASAEPFVIDPNPNTVISDLYEELGPNTQDSVNDARKGCVRLFAWAFLGLAAIGVWVWWKY